MSNLKTKDIYQMQLASLREENEQLKGMLHEVEMDHMIKMAHIIWTYGTEEKKGTRELILSQDNQPPGNLECSILVRVDEDPKTHNHTMTFTLLSADGKEYHTWKSQQEAQRRQETQLVQPATPKIII